MSSAPEGASRVPHGDTRRPDAANRVENEWSAIASSWAGIICRGCSDSESSSSASANNPLSVQRAIERTVPLLQAGNEVPFLCRYRPDVVSPLKPSEMHDLRDLVERYQSLASLRKRSLAALDEKFKGSGGEYDEIKRRMATTASRSELEELYAPYKPPTKGSLSERIISLYPGMGEIVEEFWNGNTERIQELEQMIRSTRAKGGREMSPRQCVVHLLGSKIAANPLIFDAVMSISRSNCIVSTKRAPVPKGKSAANSKGAKQEASSRSKFQQYFDFECRAASLRDHTVLAIRRGVNAKEIKMSNAVRDADYVKRQIRRVLLEKALPSQAADVVNTSTQVRHVVGDAIDDAWSRLLKRRSSATVWREKLSEAERRGIACFAENLLSALLQAPQLEPTHVLSVDPGHKAGTKVALLDPQGMLIKNEKALTTIHFLGNRRPKAVNELAELLKIIHSERDASLISQDGPVVVTLGNGHGSDDSRILVEEASSSCRIPIDIHDVNEAGASVWSVTESAAKEFPGATPASIGAISLGRRVQDPMSDLVRVPPKSLGLGMYQHDLPESELDSALKHTSIDAVALVGVDGNSASLELLKNVPGLSRGKVAEEVINARPLRSRNDLTKVKGLGPKSFENCAGFIRVRGSSDELDSTRVHPESYPVARWILSRLRCDLSDVAEKVKAARDDKELWEQLLKKAASRFDVTTDRVENIISLTLDSGDPRLHAPDGKREQPSNEEKAKRIPAELGSSLVKLKDACPVRNVVGVVRNIADFGAFIDYHGENDGLLHRSKAGPSGLGGMVVGSRIAVDIIGVCVDTKRVSLGRAGLGYDALPNKVVSTERKRKSTSKDSRGGGNRSKKKRRK